MCYDELTVNRVNQYNMKYLRKRTTTTDEMLRASGYNVVTIWQHEFDRDRNIRSNIAISRIQCNKLKVRHEHLYSSVHVEIQVNAADMSRALEVFMKTNSWPVGVFVRRYFKRKPVNGEPE